MICVCVRGRFLPVVFFVYVCSLSDLLTIPVHKIVTLCCAAKGVVSSIIYGSNRSNINPFLENILTLVSSVFYFGY